LTLVATGAKLVAYAPGRMKAAASERARHLRNTEPVFRLFGVPETPPNAGRTLTGDSNAEKESNGEDDSSKVRTKEFSGTCAELVKQIRFECEAR
jgi:hypothetical protein